MSRRLSLLALTALALACAGPAAAAVCQRWSAPVKVAAIDPKVINEASGIGVSRLFPGRLYHHNDSGAGPVFYVTEAAGGNLKTVTLTIPKPGDTEDMAIGKCAGAKSCLYFGDIGDNGSSRKNGVRFNIVAEMASYAETESPLRVVHASYPDGPHNTEGFAIHPNGDLYLLTKVSPPGIVQVFKLTRAQLAVADGSMQTFTEVGRFDLLALMAADGPRPAPATSGLGANGRPTVTSFDISPDGKRALILTYRGAVELAFDFAKPLPPQAQWKAGRDFRVIETAVLPQSEAIAYEPGGWSFLYDSESPGSPAESPIYRQACEKRR